MSHAARGYWEKEDRSHATLATKSPGFGKCDPWLICFTWRSICWRLHPQYFLVMWKIRTFTSPWGLRYPPVFRRISPLNIESRQWQACNGTTFPPRRCPGLSLWLMPKNQATWKLQQLKIRPNWDPESAISRCFQMFPWILGSRGVRWGCWLEDVRST